MIISLKELYKRFNQFDEYYDSFPVEKSSTFALIYRDFSGQNLNIDKLIRELEPMDYKTKSDAGTLYLGAKEVQPKSVGFRLELLHLILDSMSDVFFQKIGIDKESILGISYSIFLYYLVLQTDYFTDHHLNDSEKNTW